MPSLPLFPLSTVLLPGGRLPLQVFEPRYLELMTTLLAGPVPERVFGVVAIRRGHEVGAGRALALHATGTAARLDAVVPTTGALAVPPVRLHVLTTGTRRFHLDDLDTDADTPYLTGRVTWLDEDAPTPADRELAVAVRHEHAAYLRSLGLAPVTLPDNPAELPYRAADVAVLPVAERQQVLDADTLGQRLQIVLDVLRRERGILERFGALPAPLAPGAAALN